MTDEKILLKWLASSELDLRNSRLIRNERLGVWHKTAGESALRRFVQNLPLVVQQELDQGDFDLIAGKEPPGARVISVAEAQKLWTSAYELPSILLSWLLAHPKEAMTIELIRIGPEDFRVLHVKCRHRDVCSLGNRDAVRKDDSFFGSSVHHI